MENEKMKFSNGLSDAELERLALLTEECAEVQQMVSKIIRHGYESCHPNELIRTNRSELARELGDVRNAINMLLESGDISEEAIQNCCERKAASIKQWLHHQERT